MIFYTKDGRIIDYDCNNNLIVESTQGEIFNVGSSVCLKRYIGNNMGKGIFDDSGNVFNQEMFDYFKFKFNNSNFCQLYDLLYDDKFISVLGYTMKYYEEMVDNVLNMPTSYILDNFSLIYDAIMKLTDDCVRVVDLHSQNIINTKNGMIVIDYDKYFFDDSSSKEVLSYINKSALIYAFSGIFKKSLRNLGINVDGDLELKNKISSLFTPETNPLMLKCKLRGYGKSIDYLISHR